MTIQTPEQIINDLVAQLHAAENLITDLRARLERAEKLCDAAIALERTKQVWNSSRETITDDDWRGYLTALGEHQMAVLEYMGGDE